MKRMLSLLIALTMLVSLFPASLAEGVTYIPAPYDPANVDPTKTYLEPVYYENENGPTIGVTTVGVIQQDGLYFKDSNNNQVLDEFEDWRLDAEVRAKDLVSKMTLMQQAGFVMNALVITPAVPKLEMAKNEDGTIDPSKVLTIIPDGEYTDKLTMFNTKASGFASADDQVLTYGKVRAAVYRGGLGFDASMVALLNNVTTQVAEWDSSKDGLPAIPFTLISNPISAGFPDSLGMAAAVQGDGNYDAIKDYAEVDRQMWRSQGIIFMYGPQIDLVTDPRWPRNNGTYGERPDVTAGIITALVDGYQSGKDGVNTDSVVLSAKHFPGDGASENGFESHSYQGQWRLYPTAGSLEKYQLVGFQAAIDAGVGAIMPCYSRDTTDARSVVQTYRGHEVQVNSLGSAYNKEIISTLLRDIMGFKGFVNSDSGITTVQTYGVENLTQLQRYALLISSGTDAIGAELYPEGIVGAVSAGVLDKADLDRANINRATALFKQGRFENPYLDYNKADEVRATNMQTASEQAYNLHLKASVLMKNHEGTLPLKAEGTKVYVASFTGNGSDDATVEAMSALFAAQGFEIVDKAKDADVAYLYVEPKASNSTSAGPTEAVLSLVEEFEVDERDAAASDNAMFGNGSQKKTGDKIEVTTLEDVDKIQKIAETVHENNGKVVASIVVTSPWILTNLEPYCDALLAQYTTSGASLDNARKAQVDVIVGNYNPTGKLSLTMVSSEDVVALTETTLDDGTVAEICASPNDVPGYDKDQYIDPAVLANVKGGSYAYQDADGNYYVSGFGLSY
ncbi:MAG: glycoside hydrolase family 3 C-terminal domain-containing protein [Clostridia bacterium]|nr:glycoside hydrolase family 3 C-terminal domain-containing protein [Clostridia bacterium]